MYEHYINLKRKGNEDNFEEEINEVQEERREPKKRKFWERRLSDY